MRICEWLQSTLTSTKAPEHEPFQLQQVGDDEGLIEGRIIHIEVILASRLASTLEGAKSVVGLLDHFLSLLNSLQVGNPPSLSLSLSDYRKTMNW